MGNTESEPNNQRASRLENVREGSPGLEAPEMGSNQVDDDPNEDEEDEEDETVDSEPESPSDSDSDDGESDNVHEDLYQLTCDISIKQKLIEELETTQRKMSSLRVHYEDKVNQLQSKIRETELERDKVLSNIEKMSSMSG